MALGNGTIPVSMLMKCKCGHSQLAHERDKGKCVHCDCKKFNFWEIGWSNAHVR